MRWKIKESDIEIAERKVTYPTIFHLLYLREWNNAYWYNRIDISLSERRSPYLEALESIFNLINDKKTFRNCRLYSGIYLDPNTIQDYDDKAYLHTVILSRSQIKCNKCGKIIKPKDKFFFRTRQHVLLFENRHNLIYNCIDCQKIEKLKE